LLIFQDFFGTASTKTDGIGFVQNWYGKPIKPVGLPIFKLFNNLNFIPVFDEIDKIGPVRFETYADF
jgi:hypothetical protein